MHPIGLALAFLVFWSLVGVGVFMTSHGIRRLRQRHGTAKGKIVNSGLLLLGVALTVSGIYATYIVLSGR